MKDSWFSREADGPLYGIEVDMAQTETGIEPGDHDMQRDRTNSAEPETFVMSPFLLKISDYAGTFGGQLDAARELLRYSEEIDDDTRTINFELEQYRTLLTDEEFEELHSITAEAFTQLHKLDIGETKDAPAPTFSSDIVAEVFKKVVRQFSRKNSRSNPGLLVRRALLSTCISSYEILLRRVAKLVLRRYPDSAGQPTEKISASDAQRLGDPESIADFVADNIADAMLRNNITGWKSWWSNCFKLDYSATVPDWEDWCEVFARRHLIVHNDGVVNGLYNDGVGHARRQTLGIALDVSVEYLRAKIDEIGAAGLLLCILVATKFDPDYKQFNSQWAMSEVGRRIEEGLPVVAYLVARRLRAVDLSLTTAARTELQLWDWAAHRDAGLIESVRSEIVECKVDERLAYVQAARAALLGNLDNAAYYIAQMIAGGVMTRRDLAVNLIFAPVARQLMDRLPTDPG